MTSGRSSVAVLTTCVVSPAVSASELGAKPIRRARLTSRHAVWLCLAASLAWIVGSAGVAAAQGSGAAPGAKAPLTLTVSIGQYTSRYADLFVADRLGFYKKAGVDVTIVNNGTQYLTTMLTGRADLTVSGTPGLLTLRARDRDLKAIYTHTFGDTNGFVVATDSNIHTAADLGNAGARVALTLTGGMQTGVTQALSKYLASRGGKPLDLVAITTDTGDYAPMVVSRAVDSTLIPASVADRYLKADKIRWITGLEPLSPILKEIIPSYLVGITVVGQTSVLTEKREAVTRFIAGLRMADRWLSEQSDQTIATLLHDGDGFNLIDLGAINYSLTYDKQVWATKEEGNISQEAWDKSLTLWTSWNFGWNGSDPFASYANSVDMSYWNAATPQVNQLYPNKK